MLFQSRSGAGDIASRMASYSLTSIQHLDRLCSNTDFDLLADKLVGHTDENTAFVFFQKLAQFRMDANVAIYSVSLL